MNDYNFGMTIFELNDDEEIINMDKILNKALMEVNINKDIHQQTKILGYDNIYTIEDIEQQINDNIKKYGE